MKIGAGKALTNFRPLFGQDKADSVIKNINFILINFFFFSYIIILLSEHIPMSVK